MKPTVLWMLFFFAPLMSASSVTCDAGAASIPVFDPTTTSGAVGDYTLDCSGGLPVTGPLPVVIVDVTLNAPVLNTSGWILTDGLHNTSGTLAAPDEVDFIGVPFNPPGDDFEVENIFVNPSLEGPGFQFFEEAKITTDFSITVQNGTQLVAENAVPEPSSIPVLVVLGLGIVLLLRTAQRQSSIT